MLQKLEIHGIHILVDDKLRAHVTKKIGGLDRYISRHNRASAHAEVSLKDASAKQKNHASCEVVLRLPHETIVVKESAQTLYAAVDIAETKLKEQLQKYKDLRGNGKTYRHLMARLRRRANI